jgi:hypothetical protein
MSSLVESLLARLRDGDYDVFHSLIEADSSIIPEIIDAYRVEKDASVRELLVEAVWQHRQASTIPFLGEALHDAEPAVWKQAIDGLVTLGTSECIDALRIAKGRTFSRPVEADEYCSWIDEAIGQINQATDAGSKAANS